VSGPAERTADPEGARAAASRRRGVWLGLVIGVIVVSGALVAVLQDPGSGDDRDAAPEPQEGPVEVTHAFPADYIGQVWITISAPDAAPREVTILWGPYEKHLVHQSADPKTYWFTRDAITTEADNIPATVQIEPGADVEFDQGMAPIGAIDASTGWEESPDDEALASDGD
jgi:hypothetical protein